MGAFVLAAIQKPTEPRGIDALLAWLLHVGGHVVVHDGSRRKSECRISLSLNTDLIYCAI